MNILSPHKTTDFPGVFPPQTFAIVYVEKNKDAGYDCVDGWCTVSASVLNGGGIG